MLVLSRKRGEVIVIPEQGITIQVIEVRPDRVRIGISAPPEIEVHRKEVWERLQAMKMQELVIETVPPSNENE